jgi:hypothetical protein
MKLPHYENKNIAAPQQKTRLQNVKTALERLTISISNTG